METQVNMEVEDQEEGMGKQVEMEGHSVANDARRRLPKPNPFLLDHIVDNIVKYTSLTKSNMLKLRSLSKVWNLSATKQINFKLKLREENRERMKDAIALLENPDGNFNVLTRVKFRDDFFPPSNSEDTIEFHRMFGRFLSLISNQIQSMYFSVHPKDNRMDFYESCYSDDLKFPKLKTLDLLGNASPFFLCLSQVVLQGSSVLQTLYIECGTHCGEDLDLALENAFANMILKNLPRSIQDLHLASTFTGYDVQVLSSIHLPDLTRLALLLGCPNVEVTGKVIYDLLMSHSMNQTLKELDFRLNWECETSPETDFHDFQLPIFPVLTDLKLFFSRRIYPARRELLSLPQLFPKLLRLNFEHVYLNMSSSCLFSKLFPTGFSMPDVRKSVWRDLPQGVYQLLSLVRGFGNLSALTMNVPQRQYVQNLMLIFKFCVVLEEFYLRFEDGDEDNFDSILTGIPDHVLAQIRILPYWRDIGIACLKTRPGLSDLKKLKILGYEYNDLSPIRGFIRPVNITSMTVRFGIQELPKFEKIITYHSIPLSYEVIMELKQIFGKNVFQIGGNDSIS